jgi:hypothetical protein
MADDPVRKRTRRAAERNERQRRTALATPTRKAAEVPRSPPKRRAKIVALVSQTCRRLLRGGPMILRETESEYLEMSAEPA